MSEKIIKKTKKNKISSSPKSRFSNLLIPKPYNVLDSKIETSDTFTLKVDMKCNHDPGQFVEVTLPGIGEAPISICSYSKEYIMLNIRRVGNMTNSLSKIKKGDTIFIRGPYGKGYPMHHFKGNNIIIIGGGCGIAPLRGIIDYVEANRGDFKEIHLFLGYRSPDDLLFKQELDDWRKKYNLNVTVDKNDEGKFCYNAKTQFITEALKNSGINNEQKIVFICGPPIMMKIVVDILKSKGFHDDQIYLSFERHMKCGIQKCGHCMINGVYVCKDGPVFRYDKVTELSEKW